MDQEVPEIKKEGREEMKWALAGSIMCAVLFAFYLWCNFEGDAQEEDSVGDEEVTRKSTTGEPDSKILLTNSATGHVFPQAVRSALPSNFFPGKSIRSGDANIHALGVTSDVGFSLYLKHFRELNDKSLKTLREEQEQGLQSLSYTSSNETALLTKIEIDHTLSSMLIRLFKKYSAKQKDDRLLDREEFKDLFQEMKLGYTEDEVAEQFRLADKNADGGVNYTEFKSCFVSLAANPPASELQAVRRSHAATSVVVSDAEAPEEEGDDDDDDDEMPEDLAQLDISYDEKLRRVKLRSFGMMAMGTGIILTFSDPMVDVMAQIGVAMNISPFYISFVLAPLASNASELIAAFNYASKKSSDSITVSLSTLKGAAVMNNTFCLGIFLALIYVQQLSWKFTAETVTILLVEILMFVYVQVLSVQKLWHSFVVLAIYPLSLAVVAGLEACGFD